MLKSIRNNNLQNKVLLKMPKSKQDLRADLPTIGLDTIKVKFHSDFSQLRLVKIVSFEEVKQNDWNIKNINFK